MSPASKDSSPKMRAVPLEQARRARGQSMVALPRSKVASLRAFRRIRMDRLLGLLGALLVAIGVLLIFTWPQPPTPVQKKFGVEWPQTMVDTGTESGYLQERGVFLHAVQVDRPNVTYVSMWLTWKDDVGDEAIEGDTFELEVQGPPGSNVSFKGNRTGGQEGANMSFTFAMSGIPDVASVPATTEEEARQTLGERTNGTGMGTWTMNVRLLRAEGDWNNNDLRGTVPCQAPHCTPDPGNSFELHFQYAVYQVAFKKLF